MGLLMLIFGFGFFCVIYYLVFGKPKEEAQYARDNERYIELLAKYHDSSNDRMFKYVIWKQWSKEKPEQYLYDQNLMAKKSNEFLLYLVRKDKIQSYRIARFYLMNDSLIYFDRYDPKFNIDNYEIVYWTHIYDVLSPDTYLYCEKCGWKGLNTNTAMEQHKSIHMPKFSEYPSEQMFDYKIIEYDGII